MKPSIIISGSTPIINLAQSVLKEMAVPPNLWIDFIHQINLADWMSFFNNLSTYDFNPTRLLVCGTETSVFLDDRFGIASIPIRITGFDILCAIDESLQYCRTEWYKRGLPIFPD